MRLKKLKYNRKAKLGEEQLMKTALLQILSCPKCQGHLTCAPILQEAGEIKEGHLLCANHHDYEIKKFVPLFSPKENYVKAFEFMERHSIFNLPEKEGEKLSVKQMTEKEFQGQTDFSLDKLRGKRVLDAGCGGGRFISYLQKQGVEVIGIDMRPGLLYEYASEFKDDSRFHLIQANLFELPFQENSFDYIFSLGVLHHTPDPKKAFMGLVRYLKKGGKIAIWVYPRKPATYISDALRPLTTRMPLSLLCAMGLIITTLYAPLLKIPRIGNLLRSILYRTRLPWHNQWNWRMHNFMDWYGPKYQFKFTNEEIQKWFREAGLTNIKLFAYKTSAQGTKI